MSRDLFDCVIAELRIQEMESRYFFRTRLASDPEIAMRHAWARDAYEDAIKIVKRARKGGSPVAAAMRGSGPKPGAKRKQPNREESK